MISKTTINLVFWFFSKICLIIRDPASYRILNGFREAGRKFRPFWSTGEKRIYVKIWFPFLNPFGENNTLVVLVESDLAFCPMNFTPLKKHPRYWLNEAPNRVQSSKSSLSTPMPSRRSQFWFSPDESDPIRESKN